MGLLTRAATLASDAEALLLRYGFTTLVSCHKPDFTLTSAMTFGFGF